LKSETEPVWPSAVADAFVKRRWRSRRAGRAGRCPTCRPGTQREPRRSTRPTRCRGCPSEASCRRSCRWSVLEVDRDLVAVDADGRGDLVAGIDGHADRHGRGRNQLVPGGVGRGAGVAVDLGAGLLEGVRALRGTADADPEGGITGPGVAAGGRLGPGPGHFGELRAGGSVAGPVGAGLGVGGGRGRGRGAWCREASRGRESKRGGGKQSSFRHRGDDYVGTQ
jgi:hypothetical protein